MVYLDYAATTPMLKEVIKATEEAEKRLFANASALHTPGHRAKREIEQTREKLAKLINCAPEEIIFTSCASESNNTVVRTFAGCQIETSPLEHHSILEPARLFAGEKLPKLYSFMLVNNETGEFLRLPEVGLRVRGKKIVDASTKIKGSRQRKEYLHSDLTQALGKIPLDMEKLGLDYATFSAHKIGGPLGVGALYVRKGVPFSPLIVGGLQENGRRSGTYNTPGIIGFGAAIDRVLETRPWEEYDGRVRKLRDTLARRILAEIPGAALNTPIRGINEPEVKNGLEIKNGAEIVDASTISGLDSLPNILNVSFKAAEGESIQLYLDAEGIIVSTGSACAAGDTKPSHVLMAKTGDAEVAHSSIRFSFGLNNTPRDVERVMEVLPGVVTRLQQISTIK